MVKIKFRSKNDIFISTLNRDNFRYFEYLMRLPIVEKDQIDVDGI